MSTLEPEFFCPDCGWEGDESVCPGCLNPAESLNYGEDTSEKEDDGLENIDEEWSDEEGSFEAY